MNIALPADYTKLTWQQRKKVRECYVLKQDNKCYYCHESLSERAPKRITDKSINHILFPKGFWIHPIHLQHDHNTGMTEGAVHSDCNAVMWQYDGR